MYVWHLKFLEYFSLYTYTCTFYSFCSIELVTVELTFKCCHLCFNFWMTIRIQPALSIKKVKGALPCGGTEICTQMACSSHFQRPWYTTSAMQDLNLPTTWHHCHIMLHDDEPCLWITWPESSCTWTGMDFNPPPDVLVITTVLPHALNTITQKHYRK